MKKGLSVLLIAAALFGFYGGATNLNDVLACKDYWEATGEKSTADMKKLEDGLNQLKDNEEAYLAGLDQIAEGEQTLADGEAQYAQGLADYAAAPGKLAAGEKALAEGKQSYKDLNTLINGLKKAKKHGTKIEKADEWWHDAFANALKPGKQLIVKTLNEQKDTVALLENLTGASGLVESATNASSYPKFDNVVTKQLIPTFKGAVTALNNFASLAASKASDLSSAKELLTNIDNAEQGYKAEAGAVPTGAQLLAAASTEGSQFAALKPYLQGIKAQAGDAFSLFPASRFVKKSVAGQLKDFLNDYGTKLEGVAASNSDVATLVGDMKTLASYNIQSDSIDNATFKATVSAIASGLNDKAVPLLQGYAKTAQASADQFQQWDDGYQTLSHAKDGKTSKEYPDDLASKSSGVPYAFKNMVTNTTIKKAIKKYDPSLMKVLKKYTGNRLANDSMTEFDDDITYLGEKVIPRALKVLAKVKAQATKDLAAGKAQLAQGYADYKAAPGKLADAEQQLADGRKQLADGKEQLAVYEDGEQQVRDGLATLAGTEANGGLTSILDRLNGDDDFDNGDNHLELDEGLDAVSVAKGYQSDSGELITKEITNRAVGTAAGLGAAALAVLAAVLSFLKKNKGAGVSAILAAVAGAAAVAIGSGAGSEFSSIAGSTVGATPWVAAGILAAVAAVHAITHFAAKKEA